MSSSQSSSILKTTISHWLENYVPLEKRSYYAVSNDIIEACIQGWNSVISTDSSVSASSSNPIRYKFPPTAELEGRLVVPTREGRKLDLQTIKNYQESDDLWGLQMWPSELKLDDLNKTNTYVPELKISYFTRIMDWIYEHWIEPNIHFYNPFTTESLPITVRVYDLKRWTFHGAGHDSHRLECIQTISWKALKDSSLAKYKSAFAIAKKEKDTMIWKVTDKRSTLSFAPVRQFILADVPELRELKDKTPLPCQFCIHIKDEQSTILTADIEDVNSGVTAKTPEDKINAYVEKWMHIQMQKDKQQWTSGNLMLSTAPKSNNLIKIAGITNSTPKGTGGGDRSGQQSPNVRMTTSTSSSTGYPLIPSSSSHFHAYPSTAPSSSTRFDFTTPPLSSTNKVQRNKPASLFMMDSGYPTSNTPSSRSNSGGRRMSPSPTTLWDDDNRSDFSSIISPVVNHTSTNMSYLGMKSPSPVGGGMGIGMVSPASQQVLNLTQGTFKSSKTNIQMRHSDPMVVYEIGVWDLEIKSLYVLWDVTPQMVQNGKMTNVHNRQQLWDEQGTKQQLEVEIELNLSRARKLIDGITSDALLKVITTDLLNLLCLLNVLIAELQKEEKNNHYKSPFWSKKI